MTAPQQTTPETPATGDEGAQKDWQAEAEKWKRLSRENETQAKANAEAAKRLATIEEATKTEQERAAERTTLAEKRAGEAESRALRLEVAFEMGLTPNQAKRLVGSTKAELTSDAEEIKRDFPVVAPAPARVALPDLGQGKRDDTKKSDADYGRAEAERRFGTKK